MKISIALLILLLTACTNQSIVSYTRGTDDFQGNDHITNLELQRDGICLVPYTFVEFDTNKRYWVAHADKRIVGQTTNRYFQLPPEQDILICENKTNPNSYNSQCDNEILRIEIGCSYCYIITDDWRLLDLKDACLSDYEKLYFKKMEERYPK